MEKISRLIGLAGVNQDENDTAKLWGKYFSFFLMAAVIWLVIQWHLEYIHALSGDEIRFANFIVWLFFVTETLILSYLVNQRTRYIKTNWLNLLIIISGIPLLLWEYGPVVTLLRTFRIVLIFGLMIPWITVCIRFLSDNRLDTTLYAAIMIVFLSGVIISELEPGIHSVGDGIWWAWVTISTVGYGDIAPTTPAGRIFGGLLIVIGIGLFSIITANFAALLVKRDARNNKFTQEKWEQNFQAFESSQRHQKLIIEKLEQLEKKLNGIENPPDSR